MTATRSGSLSSRERAGVRDLRRRGLTTEAIALEVGAPLEMVRVVLRDAGLLDSAAAPVFAGYEPPDPDEEGLTPPQREERERSWEAAFRRSVRSAMTVDLAWKIHHASDMELEMDLEIDGRAARIVREIAREEWERLRPLKVTPEA